MAAHEVARYVPLSSEAYTCVDEPPSTTRENLIHRTLAVARVKKARWC